MWKIGDLAIFQEELNTLFGFTKETNANLHGLILLPYKGTGTEHELFVQENKYRYRYQVSGTLVIVPFIGFYCYRVWIKVLSCLLRIVHL